MKISLSFDIKTDDGEDLVAVAYHHDLIDDGSFDRVIKQIQGLAVKAPQLEAKLLAGKEEQRLAAEAEREPQVIEPEDVGDVGEVLGIEPEA